MGEQILITGFPGFIGRRLVEKFLVRGDAPLVYLLVEERMKGKAQKDAAEIEEKIPAAKGKLKVMAGDITKADCGLGKDDLAEVVAETGQVFHLAAIYDLSVPEEVAYKVNVDGTRNILDLCGKLEKLKRLDYISTCYIHGDRTGVCLEKELDEGQKFKNHYESTKCWAEKEVQKRRDKLPTAIYRPGIVIGDSKTGETDKFDGPYFFMKFVDRLGVRTPNVGSRNAYVNFTPVDFVADAIDYISRQPSSLGKVFQLSDPEPITSHAFCEMLAEKLLGGKPLGTLPKATAGLLAYIPGITKITGMPKELLVYFNFEVRYDCANTLEALKESGISVPRLPDYFDAIIKFMRDNPEL